MLTSQRLTLHSDELSLSGYRGKPVTSLGLMIVACWSETSEPITPVSPVSALLYFHQIECSRSSLSLGENVLAALKKFCLVHGLGEAVSHHVIRAHEEDLNFIGKAELPGEVQPPVKVESALRRARILEHDLARGLTAVLSVMHAVGVPQDAH